VYHAFIDKVWRLWQKCHPSSQQYIQQSNETCRWETGCWLDDRFSRPMPFGYSDMATVCVNQAAMAVPAVSIPHSACWQCIVTHGPAVCKQLSRPDSPSALHTAAQTNFTDLLSCTKSICTIQECYSTCGQSGYDGVSGGSKGRKYAPVRAAADMISTWNQSRTMIADVLNIDDLGYEYTPDALDAALAASGACETSP